MIVTKLRQSSAKVRPVVDNSNRTQSGARSMKECESIAHLKRVTRVACVASVIVIVCWLPEQLYYCLFQMDLVEYGIPVAYGLVILAFMNRMMNPFLYSFSNRQYRKDFKAILCCKIRRRDARVHLEETADHNLEERSIETF